MGVTRTLDSGEIEEAIGAEWDGGEYPDLTAFAIPASTWAVFPVKGRLNQANHPLDELTMKIFSQWLPSSGYEKSMEYEIQVYGPGDTQSDEYVTEVWIPVRKKE